MLKRYWFTCPDYNDIREQVRTCGEVKRVITKIYESNDGVVTEWVRGEDSNNVLLR